MIYIFIFRIYPRSFIYIYIVYIYIFNLSNSKIYTH